MGTAEQLLAHLKRVKKAKASRASLGAAFDGIGLFISEMERLAQKESGKKIQFDPGEAQRFRLELAEAGDRWLRSWNIRLK
jgi:hypothetical protein